MAYIELREMNYRHEIQQIKQSPPLSSTSPTFITKLPIHNPKKKLTMIHMSPLNISNKTHQSPSYPT